MDAVHIIRHAARQRCPSVLPPAPEEARALLVQILGSLARCSGWRGCSGVRRICGRALVGAGAGLIFLAYRSRGRWSLRRGARTGWRASRQRGRARASMVGASKYLCGARSNRARCAAASCGFEAPKEVESVGARGRGRRADGRGNLVALEEWWASAGFCHQATSSDSREVKRSTSTWGAERRQKRISTRSFLCGSSWPSLSEGLRLASRRALGLSAAP
jgi:hypothetical protein